MMNGLNRRSDSTDDVPRAAPLPAPGQNTIGAPTQVPDWVYDNIHRAQKMGESPAAIRDYLTSEGYAGLGTQYFENPRAFDPTQEKRGIGQQILHYLGIGIARPAVTGAEIVGRSPQNLAAVGAGGLGATGLISPEAAQMLGESMGAGPPALADLLHLPQYETPGQRIYGATMEGAVSAAPFMGAGGVGATLASGAAGGAAGQIAKEMGAGPGMQAGASLTAGAVAPTLAALSSVGIKASLAGAAEYRANARNLEALLAAATGGESATLGQVAERGMARSIEGNLRKSRTGEGRFRNVLADQELAMDARTRALADQLVTNADPKMAGEAIRLGIKGPPIDEAKTAQLEEIATKYANQPRLAGGGVRTPVMDKVRVNQGYIPQFWNEATAKYDRAFSLVPPETPSYPTNTEAWFTTKTPKQLAEIFQDFGKDPFIEQLGTNLSDWLATHPEGPAFATLKDFRTAIDDKIKVFDGLATGTGKVEAQRAALKDLRGTITDDLGATVAMVGGKPGVQAWDEANKYYRTGRETIDKFLKPILSKNTPEDVFFAAMSGVKKGDTIVRNIMENLGPEEQKVVGSALIDRLMRVPTSLQDEVGDLKSAKAFFDNWRTINPQVRAIMFKPFGTQYVNDISTLAKAQSTIEKAARAFPTQAVGSGGRPMWDSMARVLGWGAGASGLAGGASAAFNQGLPSLTVMGAGLAGGAAAAGVGTKLLARAFTSPRVVRWLVGTTQKPFGAIGAEVMNLSNQAQLWKKMGDKNSHDVAMDLVNALQAVDWKQQMVVDALQRSAATPDATAVMR